MKAAAKNFFSPVRFISKVIIKLHFSIFFFLRINKHSFCAFYNAVFSSLRLNQNLRWTFVVFRALNLTGCTVYAILIRDWLTRNFINFRKITTISHTPSIKFVIYPISYVMLWNFCMTTNWRTLIWNLRTFCSSTRVTIVSTTRKRYYCSNIFKYYNDKYNYSLF